MKHLGVAGVVGILLVGAFIFFLVIPAGKKKEAINSKLG